MSILIQNIAHLFGILPAGVERLQGKEMAHVETIDDAWLSIEGGRIIDFGPMSSLPETGHFEVIDAEGGSVMPCFCDPHTHLVYAGSREQEFVDKIQGLSYAEIARRGGGILNSVDLLHRLTEQELYEQAMHRMEEIETKGTGCVEIKSGYGLSTEDELKILRVIRRISQASRVKVVSTFLGAHAVSRAYKGRQSDYVRLVIDEMIPAVGNEGLADYIKRQPASWRLVPAMACVPRFMPTNLLHRAACVSPWNITPFRSIISKACQKKKSISCLARPRCPPVFQEPHSS